MKLYSILAGVCVLKFASAVDMSQYSPRSGVEAGFKTYLKELYSAAENLTATTAFTNFFTPSGQLVVLTAKATGSKEILALKQQLLPPNGPRHWNHKPNVTTVDLQTSTAKVYKVLGIIETTYDGGNCSAAYYSSRFSLTKDSSGAVQLKPHQGNLILYNDYVVQPSSSPTNIKCKP